MRLGVSKYGRSLSEQDVFLILIGILAADSHDMVGSITLEYLNRFVCFFEKFCFVSNNF